MKTTIEISDELLRQAKERSRRDGITLRALMEQSLRRTLRERKDQAVKVRLPVFKGESGFHAEFSDADWARIKQQARTR